MRKLLSAILSLIILTSSVMVFPIESLCASGGNLGYIENAVYSGDTTGSRSVSPSWMGELAIELRDAMVARNSRYDFSFPSSRLSVNELKGVISDLVFMAADMQLSVSAVDGDYLLYSLKGYLPDYEYKSGIYFIKLTVYYHDSAAQEKEVDKAVNSFLGTVKLNSTSDYELLRKFHDFILNSCDYSTAINIRKDYNYSSYGVFCKGEAVCQGYSLAFYRLCKEVGFDVRITISDPDEGCHAWNLVYVGDAYYYVDTTWDDELDNQYELFLVDYDTLRSLDKNKEHTLYADKYKQDDYFNNNYRSKISAVSWTDSANNIAGCTLVTDSGGIVDVVDKNAYHLVKDKDYTVSSNTAHYIIVKGKGSYYGKTYRNKTIFACTPVMSSASFTYDGNAKMPVVKIKGLTEGKDFIVTYADNINAGTATAKVIGINGYGGVKYMTFKINKAKIGNCKITLSFKETYYTGSPQAPDADVEGLVKDVDYRVIANPIMLGEGEITIEGKGDNYTSSTTRKFLIKKFDISDREIVLSDTHMVYNGNKRKPDVYISGLTEGYDYNVTYSSNVNCGVAYATIIGKEYFEGVVKVPFYIHPKNIVAKLSYNKVGKAKISWKRVKGADGYRIEKYSDNSWKMAADVQSDKLSYNLSGLKPGDKYKYRIRAYTEADGGRLYGEGDYISFTAKSPKIGSAALTSLSSSGGAVSAVWKKISCTGYQLQYSTSSSFSKSKRLDFNSTKTTSAKIKGLKRGKKYYFRVRAYKTVNGKKCYGSWSAKKSVVCR